MDRIAHSLIICNLFFSSTACQTSFLLPCFSLLFCSRLEIYFSTNYYKEQTLLLSTLKPQSRTDLFSRRVSSLLFFRHLVAQWTRTKAGTINWEATYYCILRDGLTMLFLTKWETYRVLGGIATRDDKELLLDCAATSSYCSFTTICTDWRRSKKKFVLLNEPLVT